MGLQTIITLVAAGLFLVFCEIFVPGGVIGTIGGLILIAGIIAGFHRDPSLGFGLMVGSLVIGSVVFYLWVKFFPTSRLGKKLFLDTDAHDWKSYSDEMDDLVGKEGEARTPLRPSGTAIIEGKRIDVVTRGEMVDAKSRVKVIDVKGHRVVVTAT